MNILLVHSRAFRQLLTLLRREFIKEEMGTFLRCLGRNTNIDIESCPDLIKEIQIEIPSLILRNIDTFRQENQLSVLLHLLATSQLGASFAAHPFHTLEIFKPYYQNTVDPLEHPEVEQAILFNFCQYVQTVYSNISDEMNSIIAEIVHDLIREVPVNVNVCRHGVAPNGAMMLYCTEIQSYYDARTTNFPQHA